MHEESGCFDEKAMMAENCFSQIGVSSESVMPSAATITDTENVFAAKHATLPNTVLVPVSSSSSTSLEMAFQSENPLLFNNHTNNNNDLNSFLHHSHSQLSSQQFPPDLLNLLSFPGSPASPFGNNNNNSSISFENPIITTNLLPNAASVSSFDPFLHLNQQQANPSFGYAVPASRSDFVFGEGDGVGGAYDEDGGGGRDFSNGVMEFARDLSCGGRRRGGRRGKVVITSSTEKQRRVDLSSKFDALRDLIPNPSKSDRASVVGDAIGYIKELLETVKDLKILVDKKKLEKRIKRLKIEQLEDHDALTNQDATIGDPDNKNDDSSYSVNESLIRRCCVQRKSKDTEVDVRIIKDEVIIKLVQRKKINCLMCASKVLDELKLDPQHVSGGYIGDFCSFVFNSKICEGSSVYASAIASKLIEVLDRSLAAA